MTTRQAMLVVLRVSLQARVLLLLLLLQMLPSEQQTACWGGTGRLNREKTAAWECRLIWWW